MSLSSKASSFLVSAIWRTLVAVSTLLFLLMVAASISSAFARGVQSIAVVYNFKKPSSYWPDNIPKPADFRGQAHAIKCSFVWGFQETAIRVILVYYGNIDRSDAARFCFVRGRLPDSREDIVHPERIDTIRFEYHGLYVSQCHIPSYPCDIFFTTVGVPLPPAIVVTALLPFTLSTRWFIRSRLRRRRRLRGLCLGCGYDMRGGGDGCPECGREFDEPRKCGMYVDRDPQRIHRKRGKAKRG